VSLYEAIRNVFRHPRPEPITLAAAEARKERVVSQARQAVERADRAIAAVRRLEQAPR
jgi:hypothetical protein